MITDGQYLDALSLIRAYQAQIAKEIEVETMRERSMNGLCLWNDFDHNWSTRTRNCLKSRDVNTVGELVYYSKRTLRRFRNMGDKSITEIVDFVSLNGYKLKK